MRTLDCIAVHGTARITQFMQAADVFEPWKVFAQPARYAVTLKLHYYGAMPKEQTPCPT